MHRLVFVSLLRACLFLPLACSAAVPGLPAKPTGFITDTRDSTFTGEHLALYDVLRDYHAQTHTCMYVLFIKAPQKPAALSAEVVNRWGLAAKGKESYILVLVNFQTDAIYLDASSNLKAKLNNKLLTEAAQTIRRNADSSNIYLATEVGLRSLMHDTGYEPPVPETGIWKRLNDWLAELWDFMGTNTFIMGSALVSGLWPIIPLFLDDIKRIIKWKRK